MKGVFDQQACGILILSKPLEKPKPSDVRPDTAQTPRGNAGSDDDDDDGIDANALDFDA